MTSALGVRRVRVPFRVPFETAAGTWAARESLIVELPLRGRRARGGGGADRRGARDGGPRAPSSSGCSTDRTTACPRTSATRSGPGLGGARPRPRRRRPSRPPSAVRRRRRASTPRSARGPSTRPSRRPRQPSTAGFGDAQAEGGRARGGSDARRPGAGGAGRRGPGRRAAARRERHLDAGRGHGPARGRSTACSSTSSSRCPSTTGGRGAAADAGRRPDRGRRGRDIAGGGEGPRRGAGGGRAGRQAGAGRRARGGGRDRRGCRGPWRPGRRVVAVRDGDRARGSDRLRRDAPRRAGMARCRSSARAGDRRRARARPPGEPARARGGADPRAVRRRRQAGSGSSWTMRRSRATGSSDA